MNNVIIELGAFYSVASAMPEQHLQGKSLRLLGAGGALQHKNAMKLENAADPHQRGGDTGVPKVKLGLVLAVLARVATARVASGLPRLLDGFLICSH